MWWPTLLTVKDFLLRSLNPVDVQVHSDESWLPIELDLHSQETQTVWFIITFYLTPGMSNIRLNIFQILINVYFFVSCCAFVVPPPLLLFSCLCMVYPFKVSSPPPTPPCSVLMLPVPQSHFLQTPLLVLSKKGLACVPCSYEKDNQDLLPGHCLLTSLARKSFIFRIIILI